MQLKFYLKSMFLTVGTLATATVFGQTPAPAVTTTTTPAATPAPTVLTWSGFVKTDYMYDSRETVSAREGDFALAPAAVVKDRNGADINATPNFNILSIQTRLKLGITGPDFFNYKTSAVVEGEFFGHTNADVNGFRLRHAYVKLTGVGSEMTLGQYWHPFWVPECFPGTYSYNTGVPFASLSRQPMFKISTVGKTKLYAAISSQRDFTSQGPNLPNSAAGAASLTGGTANTLGTGNSDYLRNSGLPSFNIGIQHTDTWGTVGAGIDYKSIRPRLVAPQDSFKNVTRQVVTTSNANGLSFTGYFKYKVSKSTTVQLQTIVGQNLADFTMFGGYGISDTSSARGLGYTPSNTWATWAEVAGGSGTFEWGLFMGYHKNLGFSDPLANTSLAQTGSTITSYGSNLDIESMYRVSPRVGWKSGKTKLGIELEYTSATRGFYTAGSKEISTVVSSTLTDPSTSNLRLMFTAVYNF
jgi:hypothetical protein